MRAICGSCQNDRHMYGRGLCSHCWRRAREDGTLDDWGNGRGLVGAALVAEFDWIGPPWCSFELAAARLGVQPDSLARALQRAGRVVDVNA